MSENIKNTAAESAQNAAGAAEAVTHDMTAEAVNEPVQADAGVYTHTFKKPFEYAGETYTTLTFDFEKMTGRDMVSIETEMQMNNEYCLAPEVSRSFQAKMAAKAAGIGSDVLDAMPIKDFNLLKSPAKWWRRECFKLAQATYTPVPFWLDMNMTEITAWIEDINAAAKQK